MGFYISAMLALFMLLPAGGVKAAEMMHNEQGGEMSSWQLAEEQHESRELDAEDDPVYFDKMIVKKDKIFTITFSEPVKGPINIEEIWIRHENGRTAPFIGAVDFKNPRQVHIFPNSEWEPGTHELIITTLVTSETSKRLARETRMYFTVESEVQEETVEFESYYDFTWHYTKRGYDKFLLEGKRNGALVAMYTTSNEYDLGLPVKIGDSKNTLISEYERRGEKQLEELVGKGKFDSKQIEARMTFSDGNRYATYFIDEANGNRVRAIMWVRKDIEDESSEWYKTPTDQYWFDSENLMYELINEARHAAGRNTLERNAKLEYAAREHSKEMAVSGTLFHVNSEGKSPSERAESWGLQPNSIAEIISSNHLNVIYAHEAVMNSPAHRNILLGDGYYQVGLGMAFDRNRAPYITQKYYNKPAL